MIKCISFEIPDEMKNPLCTIFSCIPYDDCRLYLPHSQVEVYNNTKNPLFEKELYNRSDFESTIRNEHYLIFIKVQAIDNDCSDIQAIDEFSKSDCKLILLVNDCRYAEIFVKQDDLSQELYKNISNAFIDVELSGEHEIERTKMNVL